MIERYTRPEMGAVWSEQAKLDNWLAVELAVVDALAEAGVVPAADAAAVRERAAFTVEAVKERERVTDHDVAAFVEPGGALDAECHRRGVTFYGPDLRAPPRRFQTLLRTLHPGFGDAQQVVRPEDFEERALDVQDHGEAAIQHTLVAQRIEQLVEPGQAFGAHRDQPLHGRTQPHR